MLTWTCRFLGSSIGKKQVLATTGLLLCGFLTTHLLGNLLIFCGAETFNTYAHTLITNPLLIPAELGLLSIFLVHLFLAFKLTLENKQARPTRYYMQTKTGDGGTFASSTMPYSGLIILIFLVLHLIAFKWGPQYTAVYDGVQMRDLHRLVLEYFSKPGPVAWYVFAMIVMGLHVGHGFASIFQSFGFRHPKYTPAIETFSKVFAAILALGYISIPVWIYIQGTFL